MIPAPGRPRELIRTIYQADRAGVIAVAIAGTITGAAVGCLGLALKEFTNGIVHGNLYEALHAVTIFLVLRALGDFAQAPIQRRLSAVQERAEHLILRQQREMLMRIPGIAHEEDSEVKDQRFNLALTLHNVSGGAKTAVDILTTGVTAIATLFILYSVSPWLLLASGVSIPYGWAVRKGSAQATAGIRKTIPNQRLAALFRPMWEGPQSRELRVAQANEYLARKNDKVEDEVRRGLMTAYSRSLLITAAGSVIVTVAVVLGTLFISLRVAKGRATVGDVALVATALGTLGAHVANLGSQLDSAMRMQAAFEPFRWLSEYAEKHTTPLGPRAASPRCLREGIVFSGVSFSYPGTTATVLSDVDLTVQAGQTLALVGDNGAGKSTLVNLLCGFYAPTQGRITIDGIDMRSLDLKQWREQMTVCFQAHDTPQLSAREVIGLGDTTCMTSDRVLAAVDRARARPVVDSLPSGLETQLGRLFESGVDLSGGQWQQLALARAMMRTRALLVVLDEPTSALDPHAENNMFLQYAAAASAAAARVGGITVLVSHRYAAVRNADLIAVVAEGRLAEVGTHHALIQKAGQYSDMYRLQASGYR